MATQNPHNSIKVANPSVDEQPRTYLTQDINVGATTIDIASISGFKTAEDFYVLIGDYGDEKAEIRLVDVSSTSGKTFTIAATLSSHEASDPITAIDYNQVQYFGLIAADSSSYNSLKIKNIDATSQFTEFTYTGTEYGYFASAYYNEENDDISGYSEIIEFESFTRRSVDRIIKSGARKALTTIDENAGSRLSWDIALETLQDGLDEISARKKRWPFWNTITTGTSTVTGETSINKPNDLTQLIRIKVGDNYLGWISSLDYSRFTEANASTGQPSMFTEINGQYYVYPTPDNAYDIEYNYYQVPDVISNMSTEIPIPLTSVLIYYCGAQFAYVRGNDKKGDGLYQMYTKLLEEQVEEYSGPDQDGTPEYIEQTSELDEGDLTWI